MFLLPELVQLFSIARFHSSLAGGPLSGANLTMLISVLESLHETESLLDIAADGKVRDGDVTKSTFIVDDVSGTECNTTVTVGLVLDEAAVVLTNLVGLVGKEGDAHGAKATLLAVLLSVFHMGEVGVNGAANELGTDFLEFFCLVTVLANFSRAHEGEVQGPEEEHNVLSYIHLLILDAPYL